MFIKRYGEEKPLHKNKQPTFSAYNLISHEKGSNNEHILNTNALFFQRISVEDSTTAFHLRSRSTTNRKRTSY